MLPPSPDPRVGLMPGTTDSVVIDGQSRRVISKKAAEAAWNVRLVSNSPSTGHFHGVTNSDLAFIGNYAIQGNYDGYQVWDISNPNKPVLKTGYWCPASQSDVSVYKNLLFVSAEGQTGRHDCGDQGVQDTVSSMRVRGIRIFDITDITKPRYITDVQTCRGSHTHTVLVPPGDPENIYVYISGSSSVRPEGELGGCADLAPANSPNSSAVPHRSDQGSGRASRAGGACQPAAHLPGSRRAAGQHRTLDARQHRERQSSGTRRPWSRSGRCAAGGRAGGRGAPRVRQGPTQCHDITVYPAIGFAGRRVRRLRPPARHQRSGEPEARVVRRRLELLVLALGHVQQRRLEGPLHRRVGRRFRAALPLDGQDASGAPTRSSRSAARP